MLTVSIVCSHSSQCLLTLNGNYAILVITHRKLMCKHCVLVFLCGQLIYIIRIMYYVTCLVTLI